MKGLAHKKEYEAVAAACAAFDFYLEPTGGIDLTNFEEIVQIALDARSQKIIPTSIVRSLIQRQVTLDHRKSVSCWK